MEAMRETGDLMPRRTLMSVRKIMSTVETAMTQMRAYW